MRKDPHRDKTDGSPAPFMRSQYPTSHNGLGVTATTILALAAVTIGWLLGAFLRNDDVYNWELIASDALERLTKAEKASEENSKRVEILRSKIKKLNRDISALKISEKALKRKLSE